MAQGIKGAVRSKSAVRVNPLHLPLIAPKRECLPGVKLVQLLLPVRVPHEQQVWLVYRVTLNPILIHHPRIHTQSQGTDKLFKTVFPAPQVAQMKANQDQNKMKNHF